MKKPKKTAGRKKPNPELKILEKIQHFIDTKQNCLLILKDAARQVVLSGGTVKIEITITGTELNGRKIALPVKQITDVVRVPNQKRTNDFKKIRNDLFSRLSSKKNFFVVVDDSRWLECVPDFLAFSSNQAGAEMVGVRDIAGEEHKIPIQNILAIDEPLDELPSS